MKGEGYLAEDGVQLGGVDLEGNILDIDGAAVEVIVVALEVDEAPDG